MSILLVVSTILTLQTSFARPYERFDAANPRILMAEMTGMNLESMGMVVITFDGMNDLDMTVDYNLRGLDSNSTCNIGIYTSAECHDLGRHLFIGKNINNPWKRTRKLVMDENGNGAIRAKNGKQKPIRIPQGNRLAIDENNDHVIVLYNQKASLRGITSAIACGKLNKIRGSSNEPSLKLDQLEFEQDL